jgi:hypothetical protein
MREREREREREEEEDEEEEERIYALHRVSVHHPSAHAC